MVCYEIEDRISADEVVQLLNAVLETRDSDGPVETLGYAANNLMK
jgi:hypothetical protein